MEDARCVEFLEMKHVFRAMFARMDTSAKTKSAALLDGIPIVPGLTVSWIANPVLVIAVVARWKIG